MKTGFTHESTQNESVEWYTPRHIFDALSIQFDLDVCSPGKHIVPWIPAREHLTILDDGLIAPWSGNVWCNPPYGTQTARWIELMAQYNNGMALVFARTDTSWFHNCIRRANSVCFLKGRVSFVPAQKAADYATGLYVPKQSRGAGSMILAFGREMTDVLMQSGLGIVFRPTQF